MLAMIRNRAILSEYTPPPPPTPPAPPPPPRPDFKASPFCVVTAIVEVDGKLQCWINHRPAGRMYYLFEGESFMLEGVRCTIKKIEINTSRIQVAAAGNVFAISVGKSFDEFDKPSYFFTAIVDEHGSPWTAESEGTPRGVIVHGTEKDEGEPEWLDAWATYTLAEGETFPMTNVLCTVRSIDPATNQIHIEAAGVVYTIRNGGSFAEFGGE
jgi:hypothetical protein